MKYRKLPVEVEAFKYNGDISSIIDIDNFIKLPDWIKKARESGIIFFDTKHNVGNCMIIKTLEGNHVVSTGDYIIQGIKGELYPCKPDIFEKTYEPV